MGKLLVNKCKRFRGSSSDIISNLPNQLIESIIAWLPVRDAVRTSILSTKWKDKWVTLPHLVFDDKTFKGASVGPRKILMTNDEVISQVLLQHSGPVLKFVLIRNLTSCPSINQWLDFLSRNGIEELTLKTPTNHQMPSSLFSCQSLRRLTLSYCIVSIPLTFSGFMKLTSLEFTRVKCSPTLLEKLIANSPLLEKLMLSFCDMLDHHSITVNAPNLKSFKFEGNSEFLCSINAPCLLELHLCSYFWLSGLANHGEVNRSSNLFNPMGGTLERLHLNTYTSQFLDGGSILKNPPNTLGCLSELVLRTFSFEKMESVGCALCLVRNSPNLKKFQMLIENSESTLDEVEQVLTLMKANLGSSVKLKKLEYFSMMSMSGSKPEMEFIKFILASSPMLGKVTITADRAHPFYNGFTTLKELTSFSRASSAARIIYWANKSKHLIS